MVPRTLRPAGRSELIRVGRDHDGGYLVTPQSVDGAGGLISGGIALDWSFEEDFLALNDVPLVACDYTIDDRFWLTHHIKQFLKCGFGREGLLDTLATYRNYKALFQGNRRHLLRKVGSTASKAISVRELVCDYLPDGLLFLKIDIEGWEYRILDELVATSDRICGLATTVAEILAFPER
jgi:hypothetical protein